MRLFSVIVFASILALLGPGCSSDQKQPPSDISALGSEKDVYTCPMHPSVISDRPGVCPICGMALVKRSALHEADSSDLARLRVVSLSPTQRVTANVATSVAERTTFVKTISAVGIVNTAEPLRVTISARFNGRIERLYANTTGERIGKGEKLFELYSPDLVSAEQDLLLALEAVASARGAASASQQQLLETSRTRLSMRFGLTEQQIRDVEQNKSVRQTAVYLAPISGTVIGKLVQEGQYVSEGQELYEMADLSRVWIVLDVYEQDVRSLTIGQVVSLSVAAYPDETFRGKIIFIDPVMNPQTRTVSVRTEFPNRSGKLKPQMYVDAAIQVPSPRGIVVPASALLTTGAGTVVWVETEDNVFEPRPVTVGMRTSSLALIVDGLSEGDHVVTSGGYLIDSESLLTIPSSAPKTHVHETASPDKGSMEMSGLPVQNEVTMVVKGSYTPNVIRVQKGLPVILHIKRDEDAACSEEIVFEQLGIRQKLEPFKTTTIRFTPATAGVIPFSCGMDMLHGKIIVE
jgi:membrane fusion protein, copper/silver efflux system